MTKMDAIERFFAGDDDALAEIKPFKPKPAPIKGAGAFVVSGNAVGNYDEITPPTAYVRRDVSTIPPRPWVYGTHLQRRTVSSTAAPGGVGKSSIVGVECVAMASGRPLLGVNVPEPVTVWLINLEDNRDELDRRMEATLQHHGVDFAEIEGRFFMDGAETELCIAKQDRNGPMIVEPVSEALIKHIQENNIDHLSVDPFVSSHRVTENDNGAIDMVAKEWARIARECNISIELVHHTRKGNGTTLTSDDMRGGSALLNACRDGRILNKATLEQKREIGVDVSVDRATYFTVTGDKANFSTGTSATWYRTVGVEIGNGDWVATVEAYQPPDAFDGIRVQDTLAVQRAVDALDDPRENAQATAWVGHTIAEVLGLDMPKDKGRVKTLLKSWMASGVFVKDYRRDESKGKEVPIIVVGEWVNDLSPTT